MPNLDAAVGALRLMRSQRDPAKTLSVKDYHDLYKTAMVLVEAAYRHAGVAVTETDRTSEDSQLIKDTQLVFREVLELGPIDPNIVTIITDDIKLSQANL